MSAVLYEFLNRRIEACEKEVEAWKLDHDNAQVCHTFEQWLARVVELFETICEVDEAWRATVFRGMSEPTPEDHREFLTVYRDWLEMEPISLPVLRQLERDYQVVKGASRYRDCCQKAKEILATSTLPTVSQAIGLREMTLGKDANEMVIQMLNRARENPPPKVPAPQTLDSSFFSNRQ